MPLSPARSLPTLARENTKSAQGRWWPQGGLSGGPYHSFPTTPFQGPTLHPTCFLGVRDMLSTIPSPCCLRYPNPHRACGQRRWGGTGPGSRGCSGWKVSPLRSQGEVRKGIWGHSSQPVPGDRQPPATPRRVKSDKYQARFHVGSSPLGKPVPSTP